MKLKTLTIIAGVTTALLTTGRAQTISIQYFSSSDSGAGGAALTPTDVVGVSAVDNWNVVTMPSSAPSWSNSGFVDSNGGSVGLNITLATPSGNVGANSWNNGNVSPTANLLNSWADMGGGLLTGPTISLSEISYGVYDLIIYFHPYASGDTVSYTIGGNTQSLVTDGSGGASQTSLAQAVNYVEFTGLTGSSDLITLSHTSQYNPLGLAGLQILDATPTPEPATVSLIAIGGSLLFFRRRK